jgi:two-component system response regulator DegU
MNLNISVAIVDDHKVVRSGLKIIVSQFERIHQVHETQYGRSLLDLLDTVPVDVVLLDVRISETEGERACMVLSKQYSGVKILVLSMTEEHAVISRMLRSGAHGFLGGNAEINEVRDAIYAVIDAGFHYNTGILNTLRASNRPSVSPFGLSKREIEVINLICDECTMTQIASRLHISEKTVQNHRSNIKEKLGVRNTAGLVRTSMKYNLITGERIGEFSYSVIPNHASSSSKSSK